MKKLYVAFLLVLFFNACKTGKVHSTGGKEKDKPYWLENFQSPDNMQLSVYWYWLSNNISKEGVEKDLMAMKQVGISRAFISNIDAGGPVGSVTIFSPEWWTVLHAAMKKATELDIEIGLFNGPGWSQSGGPWIKPSQSMRYLSSADTILTGPFLYNAALPTVDSAQSFKIIAYPTSERKSETYQWSINKQDKHSSSLVLSIPGKKIMRSLVLKSDRRINTTAKLHYEKGGQYILLDEITIDRSNTQLNVGFDPLAPIVIALPGINTNNYRLDFAEPGEAFLKVSLSSQPKLESFPEKTLAKMFPSPLPLWDSYSWRSQPAINESGLAVSPGTVIDITESFKDGILKWNVPAGDWKIQRLVMRTTGVTNGPTTPEGTGLEVDKLNRQHVSYHFDSFIGEILRRIPTADRKTFRVVVADSYETGGQNWTDDMAERFQQLFGYDPIPFLPALEGTVVGSPDISDRFLWDLRQLIAHRVAYDYVGGLRDESHKHGLTTWLENYGHWGFPSEFLKYGGQSDEIGGEFWNEGTLGNIECRAASSAAHIYGKIKVSAESFTAALAAFQRHPALLKKRGDWSFTEGINNTLLHVYIHQPDERMPGMNAWFSTEFNRHNTWFTQGKAFFDYLKRCNYLLQQGRPINDVAYFIGEDVPIMTGSTDPVLPTGYQFDYINAEVILQRLTVKDGRLTLPDGMSYRMLVIPPVKWMTPGLLEKIIQLVNDGAVVLGSPPPKSAGLKDFPASDQQLQKLAATLWGDVDGKLRKFREFGKGKLLSGMKMEEAFAQLGITPDLDRNINAAVLYTHRSTEQFEIYFLTNQADSVIHFTPTFRDGKGQPYWFDATTGRRRLLEGYSIVPGGISIPLKLEKNESVFIVFDKSASSLPSNKNNFPDPEKFINIDNPWTVSFDSSMRGPLLPVQFNQLTDWSTNANDSIKNYSGTALYRNKFYLEELPTGKTLISLGQVNVMATVKVNKQDIGTAWTFPFKLDASTALHRGWNEIEISVVNTWVNRLIGDSKVPKEQRKTWVASDEVSQGQVYSPSGLLGPVQLEIYK